MGGRIVNKPQENRLGLPLVGKIKVGMKSEKGFPMSLDYFRADGKYASLFHDAYGEKPSTIQVVFPSDDADLVCKEFYEFRDTAGKLVADGDGYEFRVYSAKTDSYVKVTTDQTPNFMDIIKSRYPKCDWKVTLTLNFILPKVRGIAGVWQFSTKGSASSVPSIRDAFDNLMETNGHVSGVLFDLSVKKVTSNKPGNSSKYPVVTLVANESAERLQQMMEWKKPIMID